MQVTLAVFLKSLIFYFFLLKKMRNQTLILSLSNVTQTTLINSGRKTIIKLRLKKVENSMITQ